MKMINYIPTADIQKGTITENNPLAAPATNCKSKQIFKSRTNTSRNHVCEFCAFSTATGFQLNEHLINEHCDLIFCCNICNTYLPRLQLLPHMTDHANHSEQKTTTATSSRPSTKTAFNKTDFKCQKCHEDFRSLSGIKYHMNAKHVQMKAYNCVHCNAKFSSKRVLLNHNRSRHARDARSYTCNICCKSFKTDSTLYTHRKLHENEKQHKCTQCNKCFRLKHHLNGHMLQHEHDKELLHECNLCHKRFAAKNNLRKHLKIHDQTLSDFICHICGAKMKQKRYLRQHMRKVHLQKLTND